MYAILHISSTIRAESLYRVAVNNPTMKAEMVTSEFFTRKLDFCLLMFCREERSFVFFFYLCGKFRSGALSDCGILAGS